MKGRLIMVGKSSVLRGANLLARRSHDRMMVGKAEDRAAVHGAKPPVTTTVNIEEVEEEINKGKEKKLKKIEEVEKKIDSKLNQQQSDNRSTDS